MNFKKPQTGLYLSHDIWYWSKTTLFHYGKSAQLRFVAVFPVNKWSPPLIDWKIFGDSLRGGWGVISDLKKIVADFCLQNRNFGNTFWSWIWSYLVIYGHIWSYLVIYFSHTFLEKSATYHPKKITWGGSKASRRISENSSNFERTGFPKGIMATLDIF